jgi:hypothetical protein
VGHNTVLRLHHLPRGPDARGRRNRARQGWRSSAPPTDAATWKCPTECLGLHNGCSIALTRPGSWTYVYGRLSDADVPDILAGASAYAQP